jgi:hypothetical protein
MPVIVYSPLGNSSLVHDATLAQIGAAHYRARRARLGPESGSPAHVKDNAAASHLRLRRKSCTHWMRVADFVDGYFAIAERSRQTMAAEFPNPQIDIVCATHARCNR